MKKPFWLAAAIALVSTPFAEQSAQAYGGFGFGFAKGSFSQSYSGQETNLSGDISIILAPFLGFHIGPWIELEYAPYFTTAGLGTRSGSAPSATRFSFNSFLAGNVAVPLPTIPLRPYIGIGLGNLNFASGTDSRFSGPLYRLGVTYDLIEGLPTLRVRGEFQRLVYNSSEGGSLPSGVSASSSLWILGIDVVLGANTKKVATAE